MSNRVSESSSGSSSNNYKGGVIPTELANGSNLIFTIPDSYVAGTLTVYADGQVELFGSTKDYTLSGSGNRTVTFTTAPTYWVMFNYIKQ